MFTIASSEDKNSWTGYRNQQYKEIKLEMSYEYEFSGSE
jgi:hypothetical protein